MLRCLVAVQLSVILIATSVTYGCQFPEYALADGSRTGVRNDWRTYIRNQNSGRKNAYTVAVVFYRNVMRTSVLGGQKILNKPKEYTRGCVQQFENNKFLVTHQEKGHSTMYTCMQFIKRSNDVIQLKVAELNARKDINLCNDENLKLDPWPLVNRANMFQDHIDCPLKGGFQMKLFGMDAGGTCSAYDSHMRLESECMQGDGMVFYFREKQCIPKGLKMSIRQRVFCTASWTDGDYTFMVIQHAKRNHQWCLRYWSAAEGPFTMYLFMDLVCDPSRKIKATSNYLRLEMKREAPQQSLCVDDFQGCSYWRDPCQHNAFTQLTCAKKCGVCNATRPSPCKFPTNMWGFWVKPATHDKDEIKLSGSRMTITGFSDFACTEWDSIGIDSGLTAVHKMMVTRFENGCRPRYTCVEIKHPNPSILRYKISQSQVWPFLRVDNKKHKWDCSTFQYHDDPPPLRGKYRSKHQKTMVAKYTRTHVNCHFSKEKDFDVIYKDGRRCSGSLKPTETADKIKLIEKCRGEQKIEQTFACLDSVNHGYVGDHMILTEPLDQPGKIRCWLFPLTSQTKFFLMEDAECNEATKYEIEQKLTVPFGVFRIKQHELTVHQHPETNHSGKAAPDMQMKASRSSQSGQSKGYEIHGSNDISEEIEVDYVKGTKKSEKPETASSLSSGSECLKTAVTIATTLLAIAANLIHVHTTFRAILH